MLRHGDGLRRGLRDLAQEEPRVLRLHARPGFVLQEEGPVQHPKLPAGPEERRMGGRQYTHSLTLYRAVFFFN